MAEPDLIADDERPVYRRLTIGVAAFVLAVVIVAVYLAGQRHGYGQGIATLAPDPITSARTLTIICRQEAQP